MPDMIPRTIPERQHSELGPSSFERAEACPASTLPDGKMRRSSSYADEGSVAHLIFEEALATGRQVWEWIGTTVTFDTYEVEVDLEMIEYLDPMVEYVRDTLQPGFKVEQKLTMPGSRMFGFADVIGVDKTDFLWTVMDLKTGMQYVPADAPQLGFYALMSMREIGIDFSNMADDTVVLRTTILQPRLRDPIRHHLWTVGELKGLRQRLVDLEMMLARGDTPYKAGAHCRWCNRAAACPALRLIVEDAAMASLAADPTVPPTKDDLDRAAQFLPAIKVWVKSVEENLNAYLGNGGTLSNARLVQGRATRDWTKQEAAIELLTLYGVDPMQPQKMLSPAMAEKKLPKSAKPAMAELVGYTRSKPSISFDNDPSDEPYIDTSKGLENAEQVQFASALLNRAQKV